MSRIHTQNGSKWMVFFFFFFCFAWWLRNDVQSLFHPTFRALNNCTNKYKSWMELVCSIQGYKQVLILTAMLLGFLQRFKLWPEPFLITTESYVCGQEYTWAIRMCGWTIYEDLRAHTSFGLWGLVWLPTISQLFSPNHWFCLLYSLFFIYVWLVHCLVKHTFM